MYELIVYLRILVNLSLGLQKQFVILWITYVKILRLEQNYRGSPVESLYDALLFTKP